MPAFFCLGMIFANQADSNRYVALTTACLFYICSIEFARYKRCLNYPLNFGEDEVTAKIGVDGLNFTELWRTDKYRLTWPEMVPEGGFEPPTRGFSIRCSTPELLGLHGKNRVGAQPIETPDVPWQAQNQSQKSSLVVEVDTVFIISGRPRHAVTVA
jgi:hypothetical protein